MQQALEQERELLRPALDQADYVIDTSLLSATQLKEQVAALFLKEKKEKMLITCTSFGFKYGIPSDADLVFDVRCLPNPFYVPSLKNKTGLDQEVRDYVFSHEEARQLYRKIEDLLEFTIPLYEKEGKRRWWWRLAVLAVNIGRFPLPGGRRRRSRPGRKCLSAIGTSARREQRQEEWKKGMSFANVLKQQLLHLRYEELGELYARTHGCCAFQSVWPAENAATNRKQKRSRAGMPTASSG